jgi:hypothetical protein
MTSRESWLSTPLSDPNAGLWASITPPANPDLATIIRRRAAAFSLDFLAYHLHRRFPTQFSSRATARTTIIAATVALGAAFGIVVYSALAPAGDASPAASAADPALPDPAPPNAPTRRGETELAAPTRAASPALDATRAPDTSEQQRIQPLRASPVADATKAPTAKAKRAVTRKKRNLPARRAHERRASTSAD